MQKLRKTVEGMTKKELRRIEKLEKLAAKDSYKKAYRAAEKSFRAYIRKRDGNICITCGKVGNEAGHYHHGKLDFDERNLNCQCTTCNRYKHGHHTKYALYLEAKYGPGILQELETLSNQVRQYTIDELRAIESEYKTKLEGL